MVVFLIVPFLIISFMWKLFGNIKVKDITNRHVVIIGGSSGIGKSLAILAAKKNAHVTIIARNIDKLSEAITEIKENAINPTDQKINFVSVDVTNFEDVENNLCEIEETVGPIYMLVNCAGFAVCGELENFTVNQIKSLINVNLLGSIYPIKAIVPKFKERKEGIIVLTGSQVSLFGLYGYSVYSSCKFALRGLAESLYMELKPYNISVTLALPPDTDTPGFKEENKTKPIETLRISDMGDIFNPGDVANKIMRDALGGQFFSHIGFESFITTTLCKGMSPFTSFFQVIMESMIIGWIRLISSFYVHRFHKIVQLCYDEKKKQKKIKPNM
ncbi:hypothetical protein WA026_008916 [Henosepilachna vigintioctopunctata]|uniref:3-dehydrosphinganine reductase n=1 Tax=Henosepilachna vigintioctopunctata TaxID=420089 RepID=A0AAW1VAR1_9CUCU